MSTSRARNGAAALCGYYQANSADNLKTERQRALASERIVDDSTGTDDFAGCGDDG